jgi:paraquat-inducible protein B
LYIELVYRTDAARPLLEQRQSAYPEIPTSPSLLAAFGSQAGSVVSDVLKVLIRVNEMLDSVNVREINRSVVASAAAVERLAGSKELQAAIDGVPEMTAQLTRTMSGIQALTERLDAAVGPLQGQMDSTSAELTRTLQTMQQAVEDVRGLLSTDSGVGYQMVGAMASLKEAADAMREFSLSLQRNPDMLIRGRKSGGH